MDLKNTGRPQGALAATCIAAAVLQVALAPQVSILGGQFDFMLALTAALAVSHESRTMVYVGFAAGLFHGLVTSAPLGLMALLLTVAGYVAGGAFKGIAPGTGIEGVRAAALTVLCVNMAYAVALFALGAETNLLVALGAHGLACTVLDALACIPFLMAQGAGGQQRGFSAAAPKAGRRGTAGLRGGSRFKSVR